MRKYTLLFVIATLLLSVTTFAQGVEQALLFSQKNQIGSARTLAMGNAFTALGGDLGALSINPASSALLKTSQFDITAGYFRAKNEATYLNSASSNSFGKMDLPNLAYQIVLPISQRHGWKSISFGIAINKVASFNSGINISGEMNLQNAHTMSSWMASQASGIMGVSWDTMDNISYNNSAIPWKALLGFDTEMIQKWGYYGDGYYLAATENTYRNEFNEPYATVDGPHRQSFTRNVKGGIDEVAINLSGNYEDIVFIGANLNVSALSYRTEESYQEVSNSLSDFETSFDYFQHQYNQNSEGAGINLQVGAIFLPTPNLRLGVTITTPTWYIMTDKWYESMRAKGDGKPAVYKESPLGKYNYSLTTPMRVGAGLAYSFGQLGVVSVDWEMADYSTIKLGEVERGYGNSFQGDNDYMKNEYLRSHILRAGLEVNLLPGLAIRGGYNYYSPVSNNVGLRKDTHYFSAGFGFRLGMRSFLDFGYQGQIGIKQNFTLYEDYDGIAAPVGTSTNRLGKCLVSLRFKL